MDLDSSDLVAFNLAGLELLRVSRARVLGQECQTASLNDDLCEAAPLTAVQLRELAASRLQQHPEHVRLFYEETSEVCENSDSPFATVYTVHVILDSEKVSWYERMKASRTNIFSDAPEYIRSDRPCALLAVGRSGICLRSCSKQLRDDKEVVMAALKENCYALQSASARLRSCTETVLAAVSRNGSCLALAGDGPRRDKAVVLAAVRNEGTSLKFAYEGLKRNKSVVIEAVRQNGLSLQYASEKLKKNPDLVTLAARRQQ